MALRRGRPPISLVLYGRAGCHLCADAARALDRVGRRVKIEVAEVDIDSQDRLVAEYAIRIPVVVAAGTGDVVAEGDVDERALLVTLRKLAQGR